MNTSKLPGLNIICLSPEDSDYIEAIANFFVPCFREYSPTWVPTVDIARKKVTDVFNDGRINRVIIDKDKNVLGFVAAFPNDHIWEIHPIAVRIDSQRQGIGCLLLAEIEKQAKLNGAVGVWAGTSDEVGATSLASQDLLRDPIRAIAEFNAPKNHPANFYLKAEFTLVGLLPDEEGLDKPGITFYKRLR